MSRPLHVFLIFGSSCTLFTFSSASHAEGAATFSLDELDAAFQDRSKPFPKHMLDSSNLQVTSLESSLSRKNKKDKDQEEDAQSDQEDEEYTAPQMETQMGQLLRGTLSIAGFEFAVSLNRQSFRKKWVSNWLKRKVDTTDVTNMRHRWGQSGFGKRKYWEASAELWFKLLRYPPILLDGQDKHKRRTAARHKDDGMKGDLEAVLQQGWIGKVPIKGWWNNEFGHFRGEVEEKDVSDLSWLHYALLPWKNLDMRFDNDGAHCTADFRVEAWKLFGFIGKSDEFRSLVFRLDGIYPQQMPARVFQGMAELYDVTYSTRLDLDSCIGQDKAEERLPGNQDVFICPLEMRPLALMNMGKTSNLSSASSEKAKMYNSPPFANEVAGPWFTYIGMKGSLNLRFEANGAGNYVAAPQSSNCKGMNPCPFIQKESFTVQLLHEAVLFEPHEHKKEHYGLKTKKNKAKKEEEEEDDDFAAEGETPYTFFMFPIYEDAVMQDRPYGTNLQAITSLFKSVPPILPPLPAENDTFADDGRYMPPLYSHEAAKIERQKQKIKEMEIQLTVSDQRIAHLKEQLPACEGKVHNSVKASAMTDSEPDDSNSWADGSFVEVSEKEHAYQRE